MAIGNQAAALSFNINAGGKNVVPSGSKADKPKAQFWINLGYSVDGVTNKDGELVDTFVSLPVGIPLDTTEALKTNSQNDQYAMFQTARNELLEQILELAQTLKPGEERKLNLEVQLRRINEEKAVVTGSANPFARKLAL